MVLSKDAQASIQVADRLLRLARKLLAKEARDLDAVANGYTQHALLELIMANPGLCMTTAAMHLAVDKSAVTRAVRRLELNRYVERRRSRRDRRAWELHPTRSAGTAIWVAGGGAHAPAAGLLAGFTAEDLGRLRDYIARMDANLAERDRNL